jgi:hypothetical protein
LSKIKYNEYYGKKTVILVISQDVKGTVGYWGLGDIIRGMIATYLIAKKMNCNYIIDIQLHPISKFLKKNDHPYSQLIYDNRDNIYYQGNPEEYIRNNNSDVIFFNTNIGTDYLLTDDCKEFIKNILTPNEELSQYILSNTNNIPYNSYNILHYRLGDNYIIDNNTINIFIDNFTKNKEDNDILMSDSNNFKKIIKQKSNIYMFDFDIGHIGIHDDIKIKNTLCEFFIVTKARKIKTYSVYYWVSGFMLYVSKLYDIKLINLNNN